MSVLYSYIRMKSHRSRDRMVVGFTTKCAISTIITKVVSSNPVHGTVYDVM